MSRTLLLLSAAALAASVPFASTGQAQPQPTAEAAQIDGRAVVTELRKVLADHYVLPETRPKLDAALAKGLAEGRYDVSEADLLAERINADLESVTPDKHLGVMYAPAQARQLAAAPPGAGADDAPPSAQEIAAARRRNHGLVQMKVLPGNIRYLETDGFVWAGEESAEAYDHAMRFLAGGDAVIIDMRRNGGGSPDAVRQMVSPFLGPNRPLMTFYMGAEGVDRTSTLPSLNTPSMVGKPLYVLTSGRSASAAEEFIGHVAGFGIGEIIGETSAGAGFRNEFFPLPGGMVVSVSVGRAVLASTGKDWEGAGIPPTTETGSERALEVAQLHALRRLAASAQGNEKRRLEAAAALIAARLDPVKPALPLAAYTGTFGERIVALDEGRLSYRRQGMPKLNLIAVGPNEFTFEDDPTVRVQFTVADGDVSGFDLVRGDGSQIAIARTQ